MSRISLMSIGVKMSFVKFSNHLESCQVCVSCVIRTNNPEGLVSSASKIHKTLGKLSIISLVTMMRTLIRTDINNCMSVRLNLKSSAKKNSNWRLTNSNVVCSYLTWLSKILTLIALLRSLKITSEISAPSDLLNSFKKKALDLSVSQIENVQEMPRSITMQSFATDALMSTFVSLKNKGKNDMRRFGIDVSLKNKNLNNTRAITKTLSL